MGIRNSLNGVSIGDYEVLANLKKVESVNSQLRPRKRVLHKDGSWFTIAQRDHGDYLVTGGRFDINGVPAKGWNDALRMLNGLSN